MREHIDWITFTMSPMYKSVYGDMKPEDQFQNALVDAFIFTFGESLTSRAFGGIWEKRERSRAPYKEAWGISGGFITLFASPELNHCCVEISGQGCEGLIKSGLLLDVLGACKSRVTRIDLAVDMITEISPTEFVSAAVGKRSKAHGHQVSQSGETCYVGSQSSDRYARVYRYFKPHPRSHLLRAEHVFRREVARSVSNSIVSKGERAVAQVIGEHYGWTHACWEREEHDDIDLRVPNAERHGGKTLFWLVHSCAPAFQRLVQDKTIVDGEEFLRRYFLGEQ
jgi:hypothetical protein